MVATRMEEGMKRVRETTAEAILGLASIALSVSLWCLLYGGYIGYPTGQRVTALRSGGLRGLRQCNARLREEKLFEVDLGDETFLGEIKA